MGLRGGQHKEDNPLTLNMLENACILAQSRVPSPEGIRFLGNMGRKSIGWSKVMKQVTHGRIKDLSRIKISNDYYFFKWQVSS